MNTLKPGILTVSTYSGFAPVCARRDDDKKIPWGTDISFLEKFAKAKSLKIEWNIRDKFEGIWLEPGDDLCDIAAAGITETSKRKGDAGDDVVWSDIYFHVQRSFLIRAADKFEHIEDFNDSNTIAVTKDSTADEDIKVRNPNNARVNRDYSVQEDAVNALLAGKIDAFAEGDVSNDYLAKGRQELRVIDRHDMIKGKSEPFSLPVRAASGIIHVLNEWIKEQNEADYPKMKQG